MKTFRSELCGSFTTDFLFDYLKKNTCTEVEQKYMTDELYKLLINQFEGYVHERGTSMSDDIYHEPDIVLDHGLFEETFEDMYNTHVESVDPQTIWDIRANELERVVKRALAYLIVQVDENDDDPNLPFVLNPKYEFEIDYILDAYRKVSEDDQLNHIVDEFFEPDDIEATKQYYRDLVDEVMKDDPVQKIIDKAMEDDPVQNKVDEMLKGIRDKEKKI
jgi:hypothetical protein